MRRLRARGLDDADDLVPGDDRQPRAGDLAVEDVQVGPADAAGVDANEHLARSRLGVGNLREPERPAGGIEQDGTHRPIFYPRNMAPRTDIFDLARLRLSAGEGRRLRLGVALGDFAFGNEHYAIDPAVVPATLDISRMTHGGYALRLRFEAALTGPCMRCLEGAAPVVAVDAREVDQQGGGEELSSPYVEGELLDVAAWARDAYALGLPGQVVCREDCAGLCPQCGANLNESPGHAHEAARDPRWAKLGEIRFE
jgi:DUF177 domain-containing protein